MSVLTALADAKGAIGAVAVIGGGALGLNALHVQQEEFDDYVSANRVSIILEIAKDAKAEGSPPWLCRALEAEIIALCTDMPKHYLCTDPDSKREIRAKAGCQ